jgi:hypothetical protein
MIYGGMPSVERERIKAAFQTSPAESAVRILLATDAASEGINLQNHCSRLIHYEIPWNPNRMEQRNGRVDRHGQKANEVQVYHFVGKGFGTAKITESVNDLEADLEFLMRAALKVETIREDLGKVGPVIASQVEEAMLGKRRRLDTDRAEKDAEPIRRMLKFERELRKQLEKLHGQLHETEQELRLSPENIENVVKTGLALAGQPALIETEVPGIWPDPHVLRKTCPVFRLPSLSGSWSLCAEGLEHPHSRKVRPIVFDKTLATGRDDVVLAHLNHRLVQMCLHLLRAEVWSMGSSGKRINRVCSCLVPDSALQAPAVIAHGRIVVLGGDNQRIHEEVIMAGGMFKEGRLIRMNVGETRAAYAAATDRPAPGFVEDRLAQLWPRHRDQLLSALEARMTERTKNLESILKERAETEASKLASVLRELERAIRKELDDGGTIQFAFDFAEEREQRERDLNALRRRLEEIPREIEEETEHLRARYRNPSARLFPVAITYLVPQRAVTELRGVRP